MESQLIKRIEIIDLMKGIGILLMLLGHCSLNRYGKNAIFAFHMPLFFLISGFLYKDRNVKSMIGRLSHKILLPYLVTGLLIWVAKFFLGQPGWGISIILGNGAREVLGIEALQPYHVGPLCFLLAYFVGCIGFHFLLRVQSHIKRIAILLVLFELSIGFTHYVGLLPFDLFPGIAAMLFLYIGYLCKDDMLRSHFLNKWMLLFGTCCLLLCIWKGGVSMASHIYKLNILQVVGAVTGSWILNVLLTKKQRWFGKTLVGGYFVGQYSLAIMCIHSIDSNLNISDNLAGFF